MSPIHQPRQFELFKSNDKIQNHQRRNSENVAKFIAQNNRQMSQSKRSLNVINRKNCNLYVNTKQIGKLPELNNYSVCLLTLRHKTGPVQRYSTLYISIFFPSVNK